MGRSLIARKAHCAFVSLGLFIISDERHHLFITNIYYSEYSRVEETYGSHTSWMQIQTQVISTTCGKVISYRIRCTVRLITEDCHLSLLYIELALVLEGSEGDAAISHICLSTRGKRLHHNKRPTRAGKDDSHSIHGDTEAISFSENEDEAMASDGNDNEVIRSSEDENADTPETLRQERGSAPLMKRSLHRYRSICDTNHLHESPSETESPPQTPTRQQPTLYRQTFTPDTKMEITHLKETKDENCLHDEGSAQGSDDTEEMPSEEHYTARPGSISLINTWKKSFKDIIRAHPLLLMTTIKLAQTQDNDELSASPTNTDSSLLAAITLLDSMNNTTQRDHSPPNTQRRNYTRSEEPSRQSTPPDTTIHPSNDRISGKSGQRTPEYGPQTPGGIFSKTIEP
ncbi:hypothetical protein PROFUN_12536 [Planoprotostelium fungivorum]|uniref:Uncharacterized protein n=1 Tax=Planoprotostelium fungivorum TaxID=1890364 RepID=A0A2P6MS39_9EUKA|nr:hypothetical protein PROFUN_12536 [Planoprotostelium fungivorum]